MRTAVDSIARSILSGAAGKAMAMLRGETLGTMGRQMMHTMAPCSLAPKPIQYAVQCMRMRSCTPVMMKPSSLLSNNQICRLVSTCSISPDASAGEGESGVQAASQLHSPSAARGAALPTPHATVSGAALSTQPVLGKAAARVYSNHIKGDASLLNQLSEPPTQFATGHEILDSIVKVFTVHSRPNHFLPWQNHPKRESTGTGFAIHGRLILTNAHCIADATYVTVKRHGSGTRYRAHVQAVGHDCDLALLSVDDDAFWEAPTEIRPLALGKLPALQQGVVVIGYPTGGDNTSVTSGVVSRVEVAQYVHSASHLMAIQIDAAINPGNSGGPALQGDEVVGVAFQNLPHAENIGYIIPTPVVQHFLSEVGVARYGQYRGYNSLGVMCQNLENPHLRKALGMPQGATGVLINNVQQTSTAAKHIKRGDVLLEFNGTPIANDGTVHLRQRERIYFSYLITLLTTGQQARVKLLRGGQIIEAEFVCSPNDMLVPVHTYDRLPTYFIYAGLVFIPLTQPYLMEYGDDWVNTCPRRLYDKAMHTLMKQAGQQIVILSQVLVDDINTGYQQLQNLQVMRVNGTDVLNLAHLKDLVSKPSPDGFIRFELEDERLVAIDAQLADAASQRIGERYRVPRLASADLESVQAAASQAS